MSANKLTDTQRVLLSAAAQHPEGAIELASDLKGGAAKKTIGKLLRDGLIEEIPAFGALPVWRRDDDAGALALRITPHGLAAIGVEAGVAECEAEKPHEPQDASHLVPQRPSRRVEAATRKKSKGEVLQESAKPRRRDSKQTRVLEMLQRQQGATIAAIMKAEHLDQLSRAELRELWKRELAEQPPSSLGRDILALGIAYARQERHYGGLSRPGDFFEMAA